MIKYAIYGREKTHEEWNMQFKSEAFILDTYDDAVQLWMRYNKSEFIDRVAFDSKQDCIDIIDRSNTKYEFNWFYKIVKIKI